MKKTPLKALQTIANVEMKEAYKIRKDGLTYRTIADDYGKELSIIEKALKGSKKSDIQKAFEIIKKKRVNVGTLMFHIGNEDIYNPLEMYNDYIAYCLFGEQLTQQEYDLLKEVLL